jgi:hypothetical protein
MDLIAAAIKEANAGTNAGTEDEQIGTMTTDAQLPLANNYKAVPVSAAAQSGSNTILPTWAFVLILALALAAGLGIGMAVMSRRSQGKDAAGMSGMR